jgi:hypothetical protein
MSENLKKEPTFNKNLKFFLLSKTVHYTQINRELSGRNTQHPIGWLAVTFQICISDVFGEKLGDLGLHPLQATAEIFRHLDHEGFITNTTGYIIQQSFYHSAPHCLATNSTVTPPPQAT